MDRAEQPVFPAESAVLGVPLSWKARIQGTFCTLNGRVFANFAQLCYYCTPCGKPGRNSLRSLLAKALWRRKIAANMQKNLCGTVFAGWDAWTSGSFKNKASLPVKGGQTVRDRLRRARHVAEAPMRARAEQALTISDRRGHSPLWRWCGANQGVREITLVHSLFFT